MLEHEVYVKCDALTQPVLFFKSQPLIEAFPDEPLDRGSGQFKRNCPLAGGAVHIGHHDIPRANEAEARLFRKPGLRMSDS